MDITKAEQIALDDALVAPANRLKIGKCNLRLSSDLKVKKKVTLQREFWSTASVHNGQLDSDDITQKLIVHLLRTSPPPAQCFNYALKSVIQNIDDPPFGQELLTFLFNSFGACIKKRNVGLCLSSMARTLLSVANQTRRKQPTTGLETLSDIALTETEQLKIAIKRSRIQTHSSQASGSGDGVDILSKVPDEQVHEKTGTNEGAGDKPEVPDVSEHHSNSKEESWTFSDGDDDDEDDDANKDSDAHDDDEDDDANNGSDAMMMMMQIIR
ncbi:hypothetical protein Tco_1070191 [Tanacetum coccineum]|uniref:Uncharacterized protein n=1 Tax=Tanacetum coccineum TaxID=301880 RepID=A0ABQ5HLV0_9ASTR